MDSGSKKVHKKRRSNRSTTVVDSGPVEERNAYSNQCRELSRSRRRMVANDEKRAAELAEAGAGDYFEQQWTLSSGKKEWFRGVLLRRIRPGRGQISGQFAVKWLNDDSFGRVNISDSSIHVLGRRNTPPDPIRPAAESRNLNQKLALADNDITSKERTPRQKKRTGKGPPSSCLAIQCHPKNGDSEAADDGPKQKSTRVEMAIMELERWALERRVWLFNEEDGQSEEDIDFHDSGELEGRIVAYEEEDAASQTIGKWFLLARKGRLRRKELLLKWKPWIANELPVLLAARQMRMAAERVSEATRLMANLKLPMSVLLSSTEGSEMKRLDQAYVEDFNREAISQSRASAVLLEERKALCAALGDNMRPSFMDRVAVLRQLRHLRREKNGDLQDAYEPTASQHRDNIAQTPILEADSAYLRHLAAPLNQDGNKKSARAFAERCAKVNALLEQLRRYHYSPIEVDPILSDIGGQLSILVPESAQKLITDDYPVATKKRTAHERLLRRVEQKTKEAVDRCKKLQGDSDIHGIAYCSDNVGNGQNIRNETTTQFAQELRYSNLPLTCQDFAKDPGNKEWLSFEKAGINTAEDLLASEASDDFHRIMVISTYHTHVTVLLLLIHCFYTAV